MRKASLKIEPPELFSLKKDVLTLETNSLQLSNDLELTFFPQGKLEDL